MPPTPGTRRPPASLGTRLRRRRHLRRAADRRLAETVSERRRPKRLEASRRLAPRGVGVAAAAAPVAAVGGLSEFATRWMFGDGVAEGVPFAGGAAADYSRPSFLEPAAEPAQAPRPAVAPGMQTRSAVEEVGPRFRLSRTPPPPPAAPEPQPDAAPDPAHDEAVRYHAAAEAARTEPAAPRPVIRVVHQPGPPRRSQVIVRHVHEGAREAAEHGSRGTSAYRAARVGIGAARLVQHYEEVKAVEALGHRVADAARGEWSKLKKDAGEWRDRAVHEFDHLKREGLHLRDRAVGEAHHLEREGRGLERRGLGEVHHLEREGRGLQRRAWSEVHHLEREPGQLLRRAEGAERGMLRSAVRAVRPLTRAATGVVRTATRDLRRVGQFEHRIEHGVEGAEHRLEGALRDPAKELQQLGQKLEKQLGERPVVRRAEAALKHAERTAAGDARRLHVPHVPGAEAAKAAALAAAAEVPLEVSRAGRAVVQFEKQAAGAAHKLEAEARHALASADGHLPHHLPHEPHLPTTASAAGRAAADAAHAPAAAHALESAVADRMYENVVDRLRRDLMAERERMGNLLGEWP